ncbi:MAG: hypothetical protein Q9178_001206 [Gyalolechia marmorata]
MELDDANAFDGVSGPGPRYEYRFTELGVPQKVLLSGQEIISKTSSPEALESPVSRLSWQIADFNKYSPPPTGLPLAQNEDDADIKTPPWGRLNWEHEDVRDSYQIDFRAPAPPGPEPPIPVGLGMEPLKLDPKRARFLDWMEDLARADGEKNEVSQGSKGRSPHAGRSSGTTQPGKSNAPGSSRDHDGRRPNKRSAGVNQVGGRDDEDSDNDDRGRKKASLPSDPVDSEDSSDDEDDTDKNPKRTRRTRSRPGEPKTPPPKGRKTGNRSSKRGSRTPPENYRTPRAPSGSSLGGPNEGGQSNIQVPSHQNPQTPPNRRSLNRQSGEEYGSPFDFSETPGPGVENSQEDRRMLNYGRQGAQGSPINRRPLRNLPTPRHGGEADTIYVSPSSSSSSDEPDDMGSRRTLSSPPRTPPNANSDVRTYSPQPPRRIERPISPARRPGAHFPIYDSNPSSRQTSATSSGLSELSRTPSLPADVHVQVRPAARARRGRGGRGRGRERDARGRFVRAGEGVVRAARVKKSTKGAGTRGGRGSGRGGRGASGATRGGRQTRSGVAPAVAIRRSARLRDRQ